MKPVVHQLIDAIPAPHGQISQVILSPPTARLYLTHGDPTVVARTADGAIYVIEQPDAVRAYVEAALAGPGQDHLRILTEMSLADAMRVKDAVLGFFQAARSGGSSDAANSSSADADGSAPLSSAA